MKVVAWHALALLRMGAGRPLVWLAVLVLPGLLAGAVAFMVGALPAGIGLVLVATLGSGAEAVRGLALARPARWLVPLPAMPTLPMRPRARALAEASACVGALLPGVVLAIAVRPRLAGVLPRPGEPPFEAMPFLLLSPAELIALLVAAVPCVVGGSLQNFQGRWAAGLGPLVPAFVLALAWRLGVVAGPTSLVAASLVLAGALLAIGPWPRWEPPSFGGAGSSTAARFRPGLAAARRFRRDFTVGLLLTYLRALPAGLLMAVGLFAAVPLLGGMPTPGFAVLVAAVAAVALVAAFHPLGLSRPLDGRRSAWRALPFSERSITTWLFGHALLCMLLPLGPLALAAPGPSLYVTAAILPVVLAMAGAATAGQVRGPGRFVTGLLAALAVATLVEPVLTVERPWPWVAAGVLTALLADLALLADALFPAVAARLAAPWRVGSPSTGSQLGETRHLPEF